MKLLITGDFFVEYNKEIEIDKGLKELFASCDYRVVNYEGPVASSDYKVFPPKSGPRLMQPVDTIDLLKKLKVDALTLANNHIMDYGTQGYQKTIKSLCDFKLMGTGVWNKAYALHKLTVEGRTIGLLNFCEMQFGMLYDEWSQGEDIIGCAWVNHPQVNKLIMKSRQEVDSLIVIIHAGVEMIDIPLPEWRDRYREMIDLGCDAVIAHHPHVVQGYEIYKDKPIAYSLGNFCFLKKKTVNNDEWYNGAIAVLDIQNNGVNFNIYGCNLNNNKLSLVDTEQWNEKIENLCDKLKVNSYIDDITSKCNTLMESYYNLFAMGGLFSLSVFNFKNIIRLLLHRYHNVHLLNNLQCESHKWCICRALKCKS